VVRRNRSDRHRRPAAVTFVPTSVVFARGSTQTRLRGVPDGARGRVLNWYRRRDAIVEG
jgi:hypothetical protein